MDHNAQHIALLIFGRTVREEASVKQFASKNARVANEKVAEALWHKTLKIGQESEVKTFISLSSLQKGGTFGERIANEVDKIFAKGYHKLIIIGTDCPELSCSQIISASEQLFEGAQSVIGPSSDHGAYLMGINQSEYIREQFVTLPWQSNKLLTVWKSLFPGTHLLEELSDIDSAHDLRKYLKSTLAATAFQKLIHFLIDSKHLRSVKNLDTKPFIHFSTTLNFRGPPITS